jgi:hypothetical protein
VIGISFTLLFLLLSRLNFNQEAWKPRNSVPQTEEISTKRDPGDLKGAFNEIVDLISEHSNLLIVGLLMLILAYPLTLTVRPYAISGRTTRVHFAGLIGSSIFWGSLIYIAIRLGEKYKRATFLKAAAALIFSTTIGFGIVVQKDYARAWELQQILWHSITETIPPTQEDLTIFIDPSGLDDTKYIDANTWSLPLVFQYIYDFPDDLNEGPQIYRLIPDWLDHVQANSLEIKALNFRYELVTSRWEDTIIYETKNNQISNRLWSIDLGGKIYQLKQSDLSTDSGARPGVLHDEFVEQ